MKVCNLQELIGSAWVTVQVTDMPPAVVDWANGKRDVDMPIHHLKHNERHFRCSWASPAEPLSHPELPAFRPAPNKGGAEGPLPAGGLDGGPDVAKPSGPQAALPHYKVEVWNAKQDGGPDWVLNPVQAYDQLPHSVQGVILAGIPGKHTAYAERSHYRVFIGPLPAPEPETAPKPEPSKITLSDILPEPGEPYPQPDPNPFTHMASTLRDRFAMVALPAIIGKGSVLDSANQARLAYRFADAMLAERDREPSEIIRVDRLDFGDRGAEWVFVPRADEPPEIGRVIAARLYGIEFIVSGVRFRVTKVADFT